MRSSILHSSQGNAWPVKALQGSGETARYQMSCLEHNDRPGWLRDWHRRHKPGNVRGQQNVFVCRQHLGSSNPRPRGQPPGSVSSQRHRLQQIPYSQSLRTLQMHSCRLQLQKRASRLASRGAGGTRGPQREHRLLQRQLMPALASQQGAELRQATPRAGPLPRGLQLRAQHLHLPAKQEQLVVMKSRT